MRQMGSSTAPINYRFSRNYMEAVPVRRMYVLQTLFELVLIHKISSHDSATPKKLHVATVAFFF
ncbi:hypothetical protein Cal7507_3230 [Calothrix sp. PCC 7507]|nr:hypothetical protein Cal7507_3230 [Calothrix sp. PCC 7507]